jgi:predicted transcriptional regulator
MNDHGGRRKWALLSNHGQVLRCITADPTIRMREIAANCGISERASHRIVADLEDAGLVSHVRVGRRNSYEILDESGFVEAFGNLPSLEMATARPRHPSEAGGTA